MSILTSDKAARKNLPLARGVLDYFPNALAEVAYVSVIGNRQHHPGEPLHWARQKSDDHADSAVRHIIERGTFDVDGVRHTAKAAWRVLALLQTEIEADIAEQDRAGGEGQGTDSDPVAAIVNGEPVDAEEAYAAMDAALTPEDGYVSDALPGSYGTDSRTPVFARKNWGNAEAALYYYVAEKGDVVALTVMGSWKVSEPFDSLTYPDLEALYDGVLDGQLIEVNNDNDGNRIDRDKCGTIDGSEPLPGYDPDEDAPVSLTECGEALVEAEDEIEHWQDVADNHRANVERLAEENVALRRNTRTTWVEDLSEGGGA